MRRKNLEVYQDALKLAREKRATGKAFRKSLLRIPSRASAFEQREDQDSFAYFLRAERQLKR